VLSTTDEEVSSMGGAEPRPFPEPGPNQHRKGIGIVTVVLTTALTLVLWAQTVAAGDQSLTWNYLIPLVVQLGLLVGVSRFGVTGLLFVLLTLTLDVGFVCTLVLPGSHGAFVVIFFSAVPLFYILGGATRGRTASLVFFALALVLYLLRQAHLGPVRNVVAPQDSLLAALGCIVLQVVMAEANEREHRRRLQALLDHQYREPNSGLPNGNALDREVLGSGGSLLLVKLRVVAGVEGRRPGDLGRRLRDLWPPGDRLFWIADDTYVLLTERGASADELRHEVLDRLTSAGLPGVNPRPPAQVTVVPVPAGPGGPKKALAEAEGLALGCPRGLHEGETPFISARDRVAAVRACFQNGRLAAVFQPIYDAEAGGIAALEALTRLELGGALVSPEPYLELIDSLGLDRQLTEFILAEAVRLGRESDYSISLNLTFRDLEDTRFLPQLLEACAAFRGRPNSLILELTEHIAFSDPGLLAGFIDRVHEAGGLVFLDDFGMGYSNYSSILAARFDAIKVAGALVRQAPESEEVRVLLAGIVQFARTSQVALVAEHVSDPAIEALVRGEGIRYLQGHRLHRPVAGERILTEGFEFGLDSDHPLAVEVNSRSRPFRPGAEWRAGAGSLG